MRLTYKYFLSIFAFFVLLTSTKLISQNNSSSKWTAKFEYQKAFIENRGQFSIPNSFGNPSEVLYAVDHGGTKIYFTKKGITYSLLEAKKTNKNEREEEREREREREKASSSPEEFARFEKEEHKLNLKSDQVTMLWQNANDNVQIEAMGLTGDYHNYSVKQASGDLKNVSYIKGYKKITYKNIYPNIDIEYVFAEKDGLKYSLILHPGANPSQVKMVYDNNVSLLNNGEIHIKTKFGDIIDHTPLTFYQGNSSSVISSNFIKSGKTVSFQLDNYDNTKTVIIDPWIQTPTFASNWDCVWECEKDGAGNVYMIGGVTPMQLKKYDAAGTLQWTYNTPYDTSSWLGTFAVDNVGNSYVTLGSTARIVKVSTAGAVLWNNTNPGGIALSTEFWTITFNCDQTRLIIGGTGGSLPPLPFIYEMNMSNGNVISSLQITQGALIPTQEVRAIAPCGNGRYYFLTHDSIGYINQTFNSCSTPASAVYKTANSYSFGYKCENWRYDNTGIAAIKANTSFVYTHRGNRLDKRNLATGAIIASVTIPGGGYTTGFGGNAVQNSGIDLDDCGNIYVGSKNQVIKFDANLNQLASYPTTYNVYDVHVATGGNIIACGSTGTSSTASRTGAIEYISAGACTSLSLTCCDANICKPPTKCITDAAFNLTGSTPGGTWSGTGITNATNGTFNPATAGVGTHVITYSLACGSSTTSITVSSCDLSVCNNGNGFTVTGGTGPYNWQSGSGGSAGGGWSWTTYATNTISVGTPTSFPIRVIDGSGSTFSVSSAASVPTCTNTTCPTLTLAVSSQTNVNCFGASTGSASISTSGGTGPYTYTWSPGNLSGASQTGLSAGIYTINIRDANACTGSGTLSITQPTSVVTAVISSTTNTGCGISTGGATVTASGGTPGYTYSWSPSGSTTTSASNLGAGNNSVTVTDSKGCSFSAVAIITSAGGPTLNVVSQNSITCFGANTGTATIGATGSGPFSYTWTPGNLTGASQTNLSAGTYTINVSDANLCSGSGTLTISQPTAALNAVISSTSSTSCGLSVGGATVVPSGGTPGYTYSWSPNGASTADVSNLAAGNNTVTITDSQGCTATAVAIISTVGGPTLSIVSLQDVNCFGTNTGTATVVAGGGTGPYSYTWTPGNLSGAAQTSLSAGTYTIDFTDVNSCVGSGTITISQPTSTVNAIITATAATNCGTNIGGASVTASGGTPGYTYSWSPNGATTADVTNLAAGNNTVTVTDSKGCTTTAVAIISTVGGPTLSIVSLQDVNCFGTNTGTATVNAGSGTGPYSFTWTPGNLIGASQTNLSAGIYTISINDVNLCAGSGTLVISQPTSAVNAAITATTATGCGTSIGGATVTANGGTPGYTYSWSPSGGTTNGISNLSAGNHTVTVTDSKGCITSAEAIIPFVNIADVNITPSSTIIPCSTGTVALSASSSVGGPYTYVWIPSSPSFTGTPFIASNAGTYTVIALNTANGCTATASQPITKETIDASFVASVYEGLMPLPVSFTNTSVNPAGTDYSWDFGNGEVSATNATTVSTIYNSQGLFPVVLTASNGTCQDTAIRYIKVDLLSSFTVPNVFTPNGDGKNDVFTLDAINIGEITLTVYDRWGLKMYEATSTGNCKWDGKTPNGSLVTDGTYFYILKAKGLDGKDYDLKGTINVFQ